MRGALLLLLFGCASLPPPAPSETWRLLARVDADSGEVKVVESVRRTQSAIDTEYRVTSPCPIVALGVEGEPALNAEPWQSELSGPLKTLSLSYDCGSFVMTVEASP